MARILIVTNYPHPAAKWLFTVKPVTETLAEAKADIFRKFIVKLIWVMKRGRPDAEPTVAFLSTSEQVTKRCIATVCSITCFLV